MIIISALLGVAIASVLIFRLEQLNCKKCNQHKGAINHCLCN